jgi:hypothetical protein
MACVYTYNGVDFETKEQLKAAVEKDMQLGFKDGVINLQGEDVEWQKTIMKAEAKKAFGTSEFMSFEKQEDGTYNVFIDKKSLDELAGDTKTFTTENGEKKDFSIKQLINDLVRNNKLPDVRNAVDNMINILSTEYIKKMERQAQTSNRQNLTEDELAGKLLSFAERLGISVTTLTNYLDSYSNRVNTETADIKSLADLLNKVIAVSNTGDISQLSEEIAHFAIEYHNDKMIISKMIDKIDQTTAYRKYAENYRAIYSDKLSGEALEKKVRKEVLGKILAEKIQDNFTDENAINSTEIGIFNQLQQLWNDFISLFQINDENQRFFQEFGEVLDTLAADVVLNNDSRFSPVESREVYYMADAKQRRIHDGLRDLIERLEDKYKSLSTLPSFDRTLRLNELSDIQEKLLQAKTYQGINSILALMSEDIGRVISTLQNAKSTDPAQFFRNVGNLNLSNLITFTNDLDYNLQVLRNFLVDNDSLAPELTAELLNKLNGVSSSFQNAKPDLDIIKSQAQRSAIRDIATSYGVKNEEILQALDDMSNRVFKDVNWFVKNVFSSRTVDNPVVKAIFAMVARAQSIINTKNADFAREIVDFFNDSNLTDADIQNLYDKYHMINPFKSDVYEAYEAAKQAVRDKYTPESLNSIENQKALEKELADLDKKWIVREFTDEIYKQTENLHPEVKKAIFQRSSARNEVYRQYKKADGSISLKNISVADRQRLEDIDRRFKSMASIWDINGEKKEGVSLLIAEGLQEYTASFNPEKLKEKYEAAIKQNPQKEAELRKELEDKLKDLEDRKVNSGDAAFKKELELIKRKYGENSKEFRDWLSVNGFETYDDSVLNALESEGAIVNEEQTAKKINDSQKRALIKNLGLKNNATFSEIYTALLEKRREIIKPYKKSGLFNQIDGNVVSAIPELTQTLDEIAAKLYLFTLEDSKQTSNIQSLANDAFKRKYDELNKSPNKKALYQFLNNVGVMKGKEVDGYPVPLAYQYRTFRFVDEKRAPINKVYKPNFTWNAKNEITRTKNPLFNEDLRGKTIQFNPNLTEHVNQEFFDLFGIDKDTDFYGTKQGATKNQELWEFRKLLLKQKDKNDTELRRFNQYFQLPQVLKQDVFRETTVKDIKGSLKAAAIRQFTTQNEGEFRVSQGTVQKLYGQKANDPQELTRDMALMYTKYNEMTANYTEKSKILPDVLLLKDRLDNSMLFEGGKKGKETNLSQMLEGFIDMNIYGQTLDNGGEFDIFGLSEKYLGFRLSGSKIADSLYKYISFSNLGGNIFVPVVGALSSFTKSNIEAFAGNDITYENFLWANGKISRKDIWTYAGEIGNLAPTNEVKKLLTYAKVTISNKELQSGITRGKMYRTNTNWFFKHYEAVGVVSGAVATLSVFDNYRLVDGKFISFQEFETNNKTKPEKQIKEEWDTYKDKTYYSYLVDEGDKALYLDKTRLQSDGFDVKNIATTEAKMERQANLFHSKIEGMIDPLDKGIYLKNPIFKFLGMHKGWFTNAIQDRYVGQHKDWISGRTIEGSYNTYGRLIKETLTRDDLNGRERLKSILELHLSLVTLGIYSKGLENLDGFEKSNIKLLAGDMMAVAGLFALFVLANAAADDDEDDYLKQYLAYISSRALSEQLSTTMPFALSEVYTIVNSPAAGVGMLETITKIPQLIINGDKVVSSGAYEGLTQRTKEVMKWTVVKNIWNPMNDNARNANLYFRAKVIGTPNDILKELLNYDDEEDQKKKRKKKQ